MDAIEINETIDVMTRDHPGPRCVEEAELVDHA